MPKPACIQSKNTKLAIATQQIHSYIITVVTLLPVLDIQKYPETLRSAVFGLKSGRLVPV